MNNLIGLPSLFTLLVLFYTVSFDARSAIVYCQRAESDLTSIRIQSRWQIVNEIDIGSKVEKIHVGSGAHDSSFLLILDTNGGHLEVPNITVTTDQLAISMVIYKLPLRAGGDLVIEGIQQNGEKLTLQAEVKCDHEFVAPLSEAVVKATRAKFRHCGKHHYSSENTANEIVLTFPPNYSHSSASDGVMDMKMIALFTSFSPANRLTNDCPVNMFNCGNGRCVRKSLVNDGFNNCGSYRDELPCNKDASAFIEPSWTSGAMIGMICFVIAFNGLIALIVWLTCIKNYGRYSSQKMAQINLAFHGD
ncbi:hypothetical protein HDE_14196 [Halotydeus destructor]|nr:hypothetical protein HDE_14196 [Halotydeus destructor]